MNIEKLHQSLTPERKDGENLTSVEKNKAVPQEYNQASLERVVAQLAQRAKGTQSSFSEEYRLRLSQQLRESKDHFDQRQILENAQSTFAYQLARAEKIARHKEIKLAPVHPVERKFVRDKNVSFTAFSSNEQHLYKLFDAIRERSGTIVGVGIEQVLDLFCNSQADQAYIVDSTKFNTLLTRTLLEMGVRHKKTFGNFPSDVEFIKYFKDLELLKHLLPEILGSDQAQYVMKKLKMGKTVFDTYEYRQLGELSDPLGTLFLEDHLKFKRDAVDDQGNHYSWLTTNNLTKVLSAYEQGKITVTYADLTDMQEMEKLAEKITKTTVPVTMLYLSNVEDWLKRWGKIPELVRCLKLLPLADEAVILRTLFSRIPPMVRPAIPKTITPEKRKLLKNSFLSWHYVAEKIQPQKLGDNRKKGIKETVSDWAKILTGQGVTFLGFKKGELERR